MERLAHTSVLRWVALGLPVLHALRRTPRGRAATLPPERRDGPYAALVCALDGLPAALELRHVLDLAFASNVVSARGKLLAFAVVARGLGCSLSESESARLLAGSGTPEEETHMVLEHLASPGLDALEAAIVPFARETIRYRPIEVQRRARELRDRLSPEQFLEVVGVVALANAVCRLGVVTAAR